MRNLLVFSSALLLAGSASAQALNESFDTSSTGLFPPTGWSETNVGAGEFWEDASTGFFATLAADAGYHDYSLAGFPGDDMLIAPTMDLSSYGAPELTFDSEVLWTQWMAHHPTSISSGASDVEVSTDGGATWASMWQETATIDGYYPGQAADLSSVANQAAVEMRFHYFGDDAHEWAIDNVVVDNVGPTGPGLSVSGTCPGVMSLDASGMTAGGPVVFAYSLTGGIFVVAGGPCAGLSVGMGLPVRLGTVIADGSGNASFSGNAPVNACGVVTVLAVDGPTCTSSNVVGL
jgi:hypothetical protein